MRHWLWDEDGLTESGLLAVVLAVAIMVALIVVMCAHSLHAAPIATKVDAGISVAAEAVKPNVIETPYGSWIAVCDPLPYDPADGISIAATKTTATAKVALLIKGVEKGWAACYALGSNAYACHGPKALRDEQVKSKDCSKVIPWQGIAGLGQIRDYVIERSTCCGSATIGGKTYDMWPCIWESEPGKVSNINRSGYGPGIVGADSPCPTE